MELRSGAMPEDADHADAAPAEVPPAGPVAWRVPTKLLVAKAGGTVVLILLAIAFAGEPTRLSVAVFGAVVLAIWTLRDVIAPVRLRADDEGVTLVEGFASRRRLAWSDIERIRLDERDRLGLRSRMLEIDAGHSLHLFSEYDLGAPLEEVLARLDAVRVTDKKSHK